ncbi:MAG: class I SAM-dependent methyltransferase [Candidatus Omnitrophota bacterium]|nr:class I SAM-dependent methyltransferase [Candidatus Omnitrophota bacterium]MDZ4241382.1 class I SAM-dependent methyltransferase [Candidatus Omnitrophota bacterium]
MAILQKIKSRLHPYPWVMRLHGLLQMPAMTRQEIEIYKSALLAVKDRQPLNIFEYGSGFSTIYFASFLKREGVRFHMDSIDNHRGWHEKVKDLVRHRGLDEHVTLHLKEFSPFWEKEGWSWDSAPACGRFAPQSEEEHKYIHWPLLLNKSYHIIIVDARFRRRCLQLAMGCLQPNGIVLMHDAQKKHYHASTAFYNFSRFLPSGGYFPGERRKYRMWVGSIDNVFVERMFLRYAE